MANKQSCERCGTCCRQGGPALHVRDLDLISQGQLSIDDLITVHKGELAFQPLSQEAQPVEQEFLKLQGQAGSWCCTFYDAALEGCRIYEHRPLACRLLECHAPEAVLDIVNKDLITRFDIIESEDPLLELVEEQVKECACPDMEKTQVLLQDPGVDQDVLNSLEQLANRDLDIRSRAASRYKLSVAREMFYFGRPLFQLLAPLGVYAANGPQGVTLSLTIQ